MNFFKNIALLIALFSIVTTISPMDPVFERGDGYWTSKSDERREDFFGQLTPPKSQRENWYEVSPYVAEFWCALSNAGFMYVGLKHECPELLFACAASIASHAIPKKWLHTLDLVGVAAVGLKILREHKTVLDNPWLLAPVGAMGVINAADAYLARNKGKTWPHVVWHLSAAALAGVFLSHTK